MHWCVCLGQLLPWSNAEARGELKVYIKYTKNMAIPNVRHVDFAFALLSLAKFFNFFWINSILVDYVDIVHPGGYGRNTRTHRKSIYQKKKRE